jgi:hypothetical protein
MSSQSSKKKYTQDSIDIANNFPYVNNLEGNNLEGYYGEITKDQAKQILQYNYDENGPPTNSYYYLIRKETDPQEWSDFFQDLLLRREQSPSEFDPEPSSDLNYQPGELLIEKINKKGQFSIVQPGEPTDINRTIFDTDTEYRSAGEKIWRNMFEGNVALNKKRESETEERKNQRMRTAAEERWRREAEFERQDEEARDKFYKEKAKEKKEREKKEKKEKAKAKADYNEKVGKAAKLMKGWKGGTRRRSHSRKRRHTKGRKHTKKHRRKHTKKHRRHTKGR